MKISTLIIYIVLFANYCYGQYGLCKDCPCIKLTVEVKSSNLHKDAKTGVWISNGHDLKNVIFEYKLFNCGNQPILIDTNEILDFPDMSEFSTMYFRIYKHSLSGFIPYYIKSSTGHYVPDENNKYYTLKTSDSFKYSFDFFKYYNLTEAGEYRIVGYYKYSLQNNPGIYIAYSNYIDFVIKK